MLGSDIPPSIKIEDNRVVEMLCMLLSTRSNEQSSPTKIYGAILRDYRAILNITSNSAALMEGTEYGIMLGNFDHTVVKDWWVLYTIVHWSW